MVTSKDNFMTTIRTRENALERYLEALLDGDRVRCRSVIEEVLQTGLPANRVYMDIIWPIMVEIDNLYHQDRIDSAQQAFASRINRTIVDQLQNKLPRHTVRSKKIVICSAPDENAELGGQMMSDLFESDGWETRFLGGNVNNDDLLSFIHRYRPDVLLLYGVKAKDAPQMRRLIDTVRKVNACPEMRIMLSSGVFSNAEGLWEEIGADVYASNATEAVRLADVNQNELLKPTKTIKRRKKLQTQSVSTEQISAATI
jgi:methanogenic corrinoid protein MtbC1